VLKTKRILKPKYKLSWFWFLHLVCQGGSPFYPDSYARLGSYGCCRVLSLSCSLCACLDPSDFKRAQRQVDEEGELLSVQATEGEKYAACEKFVFRFAQTSREIKFDCGVFTEKVGLRRGGRADLFFWLFLIRRSIVELRVDFSPRLVFRACHWGRFG